MEKTNILLEYCARCGVHKTTTLSDAQIYAEEKFQNLVGRQIMFDEMKSIQRLIGEISDWSPSKSYVISAA